LKSRNNSRRYQNIGVFGGEQDQHDEEAHVQEVFEVSKKEVEEIDEMHRFNAEKMKITEAKKELDLSF
jgi:hypothetical protein